MIDAAVHDVFEYCRDPRHLFAGWPQLEVTEVVITPDGVGTTAHITGRFLNGLVVEQIEREFTEVVPRGADRQRSRTRRFALRDGGGRSPTARLHPGCSRPRGPDLCDLDYVVFEALGPGLTRSGTLARGCDRCDFRVTNPGSTTSTWPPLFAERSCGVPRPKGAGARASS